MGYSYSRGILIKLSNSNVTALFADGFCTLYVYPGMKETQPVIEALAAGTSDQLRRELGDQAADANLVQSLQSYGKKGNERFHDSRFQIRLAGSWLDVRN